MRYKGVEESTDKKNQGISASIHPVTLEPQNIQSMQTTMDNSITTSTSTTSGTTGTANCAPPPSI
jgi:hypothetical protein